MCLFGHAPAVGLLSPQGVLALGSPANNLNALGEAMTSSNKEKIFLLNDTKTRCGWCLNDPIYINYHDREWGVPVHADKKLFEFLILEGAQAGLSWITILKRREGYRKAFCHFKVEEVAKLGERDVKRLMNDP